MKKSIAFLFLATVFITSCNSESLSYTSEEPVVIRFNFIDYTSGKQYSGIFNENKDVLFCGEGKIFPFIGGYSFISNDAGNNTAINSKGESLFTFKLGEIYDYCYGYGLYRVFDDKSQRNCFVNQKGDRVSIKQKFIIIGERYGVVTFETKKDTKTAYYDFLNGKYLTDKLNRKMMFDFCYDFIDGYAIINESDYLGVINEAGKKVIPCKYKYLERNSTGFFTASSNDKYPSSGTKQSSFGVLNVNGEWEIEPEYNFAYAVTDKVFALIKDNQWFLFNKETNNRNFLDKNIRLFSKGNINCKGTVQDGLFIFYDDEKKLYGLMDFTGKILLDSEYSIIENNPDNGFWRIKKGNTWFLFNKGLGILNPIIDLSWK